MTPSLRHRYRWPVVAALPLLLLAAAPTAEPGITYDFSITASSAQGNAKPREVYKMQGRGQVAGGNARVDLADVKGGAQAVESGGYVIVRDEGARMLMVDPKEKQYYAFDPAEMLAATNSMMKSMGSMVKMEMANPRVTLEVLGDGGTIHGYATRKVRMTQSYSMTVRAMGFGGTTKSADTTDMWIATSLKDIGNPFLRMGNAAAQVDFGNPEYARQLKAANARMPAGVPLKSESRTVSVDEKGKTSVSHSVMEITNLRQGDVPRSAFDIPASYKEIPSPFTQMAAMGDSLDAAGRKPAAARGEARAGGDENLGTTAADAAKEGAQEGVKESVKEQTKAKLRGVFRRP